MKHKIKIITITVLAISGILQAKAQELIYEKEDSIFIERIIQKHAPDTSQDCGERIIAIAKEFCGNQYVAGTLDRHDGEPLFISCTELDCTTFVELVISLAMTNGEECFETVCHNLEKLRYRNGKRNGYVSRLHYISWWIADTAKRNTVNEIYTQKHTAEQVLELKFMSSNPDRYAKLKDCRQLTDSIALHERNYGKRTIEYIPKGIIDEIQEEEIKNGDIIAIVTDIEGLDISHMGLAYWNEGKLHMIHASGSKNMVICDPKPLTTYLADKKHHIGIRIFRVL